MISSHFVSLIVVLLPVNLVLMLSSASFCGIHVNKLLTSNDTRRYSGGIICAFKYSFAAMLFFNFYGAASVIGVRRLDKNFATKYVGESMKETMGRMGYSTLCVLIRA